MTLYLIKGYLDVAATTLADAQSLYTAMLDPSDATNAATIDRVMGKIETLVQSDTGEPITVVSIDDAAGTISSWITDDATSVELGLGDPDINNNALYAAITTLTISGSSRIGTLALNTTAMACAVSRGRSPGLPFTLQLRKTVGGATETMCLLAVQVRAGVLTQAATNLAPDTYLTEAQTAATYFAIANTALAADVANSINVATWGDSLTNAGYQQQLAGLTGYTIYDGGVPSETSTQIKARMLAATSKYGYMTIIWAGENNYTAHDTVISDIAAMITALGHTRYLVLGLIKGEYANEYNGGVGAGQIDAINDSLAATYGAHYLDTNAFLLTKYDPNVAQDVIDYGHGIVPSTLRSDARHVNALGSRWIAVMINAALATLQGTYPKTITPAIVNNYFQSSMAMPRHRSWTWAKRVENSGTFDLFSLGQYASGILGGLLTLHSAAIDGAGGHTVKVYAVSMIAYGSGSPVTQISSQDYTSGAAAFSLSTSSANGNTTVTFNNSYAGATYLVASLLITHTEGTINYLT